MAPRVTAFTHPPRVTRCEVVHDITQHMSLKSPFDTFSSRLSKHSNTINTINNLKLIHLQVLVQSHSALPGHANKNKGVAQRG